MAAWMMLCVVTAFFIISWKNTTFVHGGQKQEAEPSHRNFQNSKRNKKSKTVNYLGKELQYIAQVYRELQNKSGCNDVAVLNITFDSERWKNEAFLAVEVANLLTSLWPVKKSDGQSVAENDTLLFEITRANVLFSPSVFGSVVCLEPKLYRNKRFCPYAFKDRKLNGRIHVMDFAQSHEYDYSTSPNAIWWAGIRDKTRNTKMYDRMQATDFYSIEQENASVGQNLTRLLVRYEDGLWTRPYFDCFGGKVWMITFLAPIFNESSEFLGTVSIDISLKDVDINQCDSQASSAVPEMKESGNKQAALNTFLGTHRCKASTRCDPVPFQGFKRGSYLCTCKRGYYFPDISASHKYFNGNILEEEYDKMLRGEVNSYEDGFECLACSEGCNGCVDDRACVYNMYTGLRYALLVINGLVIVLSLVFATLVYKYWQNKIFKASSPLFLEVVIFGAIIMYTELLITFPRPSRFRCALLPWFHHVGFSLVYGSLALKTWRVVLIFRVRSARKVSITDSVLLKKLSAILLLYVSYLAVWMVIQPPSVETSVTPDKLKYEQCSQGWFGYMILAADVTVLAWGMWLSFKVRRAPQVYNESRFISYTTYNAMFVMCFINVLSAVLRNGTSPEVTYALEFTYTHVIASVTLVLLFSHKICLLLTMKNNQQRTAPLHVKISTASANSTDGQLTEELNVTTLGRENSELKRPIHNAAEPILLTVLERQLKQQVGLSPPCQPWQKKLRRSGNDYVQSQPHVNQKRLKKCSIREPLLFQPNPVLVEMVDPNRTRPKSGQTFPNVKFA